MRNEFGQEFINRAEDLHSIGKTVTVKRQNCV
jgi:hypothetical protein